MSISMKRSGLAVGRIATVAGLSALALAGCHSSSTPATPKPGTPEYQQIVSAFYSGATALEVGDVEHAPAKLDLAAKLAPTEPAVWANLALNQLRSSQIDAAVASLKKAQDLAPGNPDIMALAAHIAVDKGDFPGAIAQFQKAIAADPNNIRTRWALYQVIQQQGGADADSQGEGQLKDILKLRPGNVALLVELARLAAKNGETDDLKQYLTMIGGDAAGWPSEAKDQLNSAVKAAAGTDPRASVPEVMKLHNELIGFPAFQKALSELQVADGTVADPIEHFIALPTPPDAPAPADSGLTFTAQPLAVTGKPSVVKSIWLTGDGKPATVTATASQIQIGSTTLPFPGGSTAPSAASILSVDLNDDGLVDLVLAGAGGLKIYQQSAGGRFADVTAAAKLPAAVVSGKYTSAYAANLYTGGAIDIVLGSATGSPTALRNNDNGTFTAIHPFEKVDGLRAFTWVDLDGDGVGDAALIDGNGALHLFDNQRAGNFKESVVSTRVGGAVAITAVDLNRTGAFSAFVWFADGSMSAINIVDGKPFIKPLVVTSPAPKDGSGQLIWADLDNNGAPDLVVASSIGTQVLLGDDKGALVPLTSALDVKSASIDDDGVSGRLNLIGLSSTGAPTLYKNTGTKNYHWQQIRLQSVSKGDGKNNSFGIGGQISLRAGLLYENQPVDAPVTHFGLGTYAKSDYARILWPNGLPQGEFELNPDQVAQTPERLKGSCPWLFAWNGQSMAFITDFLWRSALGLRINAQGTSGGGMSGDWNKIGGDELVPRDGFYDLRLCTQLWESYFFDQMKLMVVDHPAGTDMWVDERFCIPPPALKYHITTPAQPVPHAVDDLGHDVTDILTARDGRYLDTFGLGRYQGLTRDHYVQVDLGPAPSTPPSPFQGEGRGEVSGIPHSPVREWLLAEGWIHPTDSSINMQLSLGDHPRPTGLSLEVPDGHGGWRVARTGLGFPEGKNKTILIDVTGLFKPGQPRQVRLRTNLELYWDWMATATEIPGAKVEKRVIDPTVADLRYHGFNKTLQPSHSSPEVPDYGQLASVGQQWRDMEGFYTRFGDVRPLLTKVDDRYVIMNAGDEINLRFPATAPVAAGMVRDYVMIGDGWGKDCDINSGYSKTILPLPSHADLAYNHQVKSLYDDPVYKAHAQDWVDYQTRYVSPQSFRTAVLPH